MSHTNRPPPAYQEYATDILASRSYRMMSLSEKGLWDQMRKECWANGSIPSQPSELAKYLGLPLTDVEAALTKNVRSWFEDDGETIVSPELEAYRVKLEESRRNMAAGGAKGGRRTQAKRKGTLQSSLESQLKPLNRVELNRNEQRGEELSKEVLSTSELQQWVDDYDGAGDGSNRYSQQSNGY